MENMTAADVAELAHTYFTSPEAHFGKPPAEVARYGNMGTLPDRRETFRRVYEAVVGRIGEPTLLGGSADGPSVRWRSDERLVLLAADGFAVRLSVHVTDELEGEENRTFKWGGAWSANEPHDFDMLPYIWQLDREGPGTAPSFWPGGRLAACWEHLEEALRLMLAAWAEQIPVQVPGDWASFSLLVKPDGRRRLLVSLQDDELFLRIDDRTGEDTPERAAEMKERGWQVRTAYDWEATFPEPDEKTAAAAARLIVAEVRARGAQEVKDLEPYDVSCNDHGIFTLPGLGVGRDGDW
ncbi:hypothetical protein [Streptomyces sp. NPDC050504]|uniref:hypothetical protein n=1 Tax=Streptomyces sp. NPDC050504 TaxID=3365618 RepID=UPI0037946E0A